MGGSASQPIEAVEEQEGVFSLSAKMQQQLAQDFHNEQIIKLFGKQIEAIGERKAQILESSLEQRAKLEQKMSAFRQQNGAVQEKLDATLEGLEDKFTDLSNAVEYDMERLEKQYLGNRKAMAPMTYCGQERSDIVACYQHSKSSNDTLACDAFVKALAKCTEKTVVGGGKDE
jgi:hypothetical protein